MGLRRALETDAPLVLLLVLVVIASIATIFILPKETLVRVVAEDVTPFYPLVYMTIALFVLLVSLLLLKWDKTENTTFLIWAIAFLINSVPFFLLAFGYSYSQVFPIYRTAVLFWAIGMYYGTVRILSKSWLASLLPSITILMIGIIWIIQDVISGSLILFRLSILVLIYGIIAPIITVMSYSFFKYGKDFKKVFAGYMGLGFMLLTIFYFFWPLFYSYGLFQIWSPMHLLALIVLIKGVYLIDENKSKNKR